MRDVCSDRFEKPDGWLSPDGEWYSCDTAEHALLAFFIVKKLHISKPVDELCSDNDKERLMARGWLAISRRFDGDYSIESLTKPNTLQRVKLRKWFETSNASDRLRFNDTIIISQYDDFLVEV